MWIERCNNWRCRRPYQVNEFKNDPHGLFEHQLRPEEICCPHCGNKEIRWSESVFLVHALSTDEEERFQRTDHAA